VNKAELIDVVTGRLGDKRTATAAVEAVLTAVQRTVSAGEKVALSGFGVFEKVDRAARTARNPATGAAIQLPATSVPRFRPGQGFKDVVSGARELPDEGEPPTVPAMPPARPRSAPAGQGAEVPEPRAAAVTAGVPVAPAAESAGPPSPRTTTRGADQDASGANKPGAKKPGAKKSDVKKSDVKKADVKKPDVKKADAKKGGKPDAKAGAKKSDAKQGKKKSGKK